MDLRDMAVRLFWEREKAGYTQEQAAQMLHITRQALSNYECAKRIPRPAHLADIARLYQVSLDYLMFGQEK